MRSSTCLLHGSRLRPSENLGEQKALLAARKARESATLLERVFRLMTEDDSIQPAIKYVYAALCEAETRASVIEDWYEHAYSDSVLSERSRRAIR